MREATTNDFFEGFFTTAIQPDELLTEVQIPQWPASTGHSLLEVCRRRGDFAQVAVAAVVSLDDNGRVRRAGVGIAGAAGVPVTATDLTDRLQGEAPSERAVAQLAAEFADGLTPPGDSHGPTDYRRHLVRHLVPRAVARAVGRANEAETPTG